MWDLTSELFSNLKPVWENTLGSVVLVGSTKLEYRNKFWAKLSFLQTTETRAIYNGEEDGDLLFLDCDGSDVGAW